MSTSLSVAALNCVFFAAYSACMLDPAQGGIGMHNAFSWHPVLMMAGIITLSIGMSAYADGCSPRVRAILGTSKLARRKVHAVAGVVGGSLVLLGWLVGWGVHEYRRRHTPAQHRELHDSAAKALYLQIHVWLGRAACVAIVMQACVGAGKFVVWARRGRACAGWHGTAGLVLWSALVAVAALGTFRVWGDDKESWRTCAVLIAGLAAMWTAAISLALARKHGGRIGALSELPPAPGVPSGISVQAPPPGGSAASKEAAEGVTGGSSGGVRGAAAAEADDARGVEAPGCLDEPVCEPSDSDGLLADHRGGGDRRAASSADVGATGEAGAD